MIILDTSVVSEPMKANSQATVQIWLDKQDAETLYLTTMSLSELLVGIEILPDGERKEGLDIALNKLLIRLFGSCILSFDREAALAYAYLVNYARSKGYLLAVADGQIAAIAATQGFIIATRDTAPFSAAGISVINPWEE